MGARYVMNSAVMTTPGEYEYKRLTIDDAKKWLRLGAFQSAIAYEATAEAMAVLLDCRPSVNRHHVKMEVGDETLVFRITMSVTRYETMLQHRDISPDFVANNAEIGLMRRIG